MPLTLGIETLGGVLTPLIERNTTIPTQKKQIFSTASDNQPAVTIVVIQGERPMAKDNKEIGRFDLTDIPPAPRGVPQIEVCFDLNADGILSVSAKDKQSGKEQKIRIEAKSGLSDEDIKVKVEDQNCKVDWLKVEEAEKHKEEDKKKKEQIDTKNEAEATVFRAEKAITDYKDKLPSNISSEIQTRIDKVKEAIKADDTATIKTAMTDLQTHMQKIGEELQKAQGAQNPKAGAAKPEAGAPNTENKDSAKKEDIEEAEAEIIEDEKK